MAVCKDCQDRHPGCHGECEEYQAYRKLRDAAIEERRKRRLVDEALLGKHAIRNQKWKRGMKK